MAPQVCIPQSMALTATPSGQLGAVDGAAVGFNGAVGEGTGLSEVSTASGTGTCTFVVAAPPLVPPFLAATSGGQCAPGLVAACDWRASSALQRTHFQCPQCHFASPLSSALCLNSECQTVAALVARRSSPEEAAALRALSLSCHYAKRLHFLKGRGQACMPTLTDRMSSSPALCHPSLCTLIALDLHLCLPPLHYACNYRPLPIDAVACLATLCRR